MSGLQVGYLLHLSLQIGLCSAYLFSLLFSVWWSFGLAVLSFIQWIKMGMLISYASKLFRLMILLFFRYLTLVNCILVHIVTCI